MGAKPRMMVRLAPSIEHAVHYIAEREGSAPAEVARSMITTSVQTALDQHGWRRDCQDAYMRWLDERTAEKLAKGARQAPDLVDAVDEGISVSPPTRPVEPVSPYGLTGDQMAGRGGGDRAPARRDVANAEAERLAARFRPDGRKRRT